MKFGVALDLLERGGRVSRGVELTSYDASVRALEAAKEFYISSRASQGGDR